jgi:tRNA nucleotidyltransferase (CCA-adding enzyme)
MMGLSEQEIRIWADEVRMPIDVRDFSEIFRSLYSLLKQFPDGRFQPVDTLAWFNRADVWRKPDRAHALLSLAEKLGLHAASLFKAMRSALAINTAEVISGVAAQDRSNGERIGSAFESARLAAITVALASP